MYCEKNEEICKQFGINLTQEGNTSALLGEDDITILEAMLITLGVIVGLGGLFGIFLLCCLRRRFEYSCYKMFQSQFFDDNDLWIKERFKMAFI